MPAPPGTALVANGWDAPVLGRIVEIVERRAKLPAQMAAPSGPVARADHSR